MGGVGVQLQSFISAALDGGEWSSSRQCHFLPGEEAQCPLTPGGPQRRFGHSGEEKSLTLIPSLLTDVLRK